MLLPVSIRVAEDSCLGKSCSLDLLCIYYVYVYQFVRVLYSLLVSRVGCGN